MRISILPLVIILLGSSVHGFSQATCATAVPITTCATTAVSASTGNPTGTCAAGGSRRVTWFQFTAGAECPAISFSVSAGGAAEVAMFTDCAAVTPVAGTVACFTNGNGVWSPSAALTNGTTYYLRVWTNSTTGNISACNIAGNANTIDITGSCGDFPVSTTTGLPVLGCGYTNAQRFVTWFKFTADATCPMLSFDNSQSTPAVGIQTEVALYPACGTNAALSPITASSTCLANGSGLWAPQAGALVVGNTYYIRVWSNTGTAGRINICNVINTAQQLDLDKNCYDVDLSQATSGGTVSSAANCPIGTSNRRISWVKFHTSSPNQCVTINVTNPGISTEVALYSSGCGAAIKTGTSVCFTDGNGVWSAGPNYPTNGYTPGVDYYLRILTNWDADGVPRQISLCGTERTTAVNDFCANASAFNYSAQTYTNACAHWDGTANEGFANTEPNTHKMCAYSLQNTVWYKFKVRQGGTPAVVTISNIDCDSYSNQPTLLQMGLLTGSCGTFNSAITPVLSGTPAFPTNNTPMSPTSCLATSGTGPYNLYTSSSVTAGQDIYLAIDGYSGANCKFTLQASQNIAPIPIHLKYFTAWINKSVNLIRWITSWEHNNAYFEIERSLDGTNFESIGRVAGNNESSIDIVYDFEDKFPPAVAYYRLKQVDIDEKYEYSNVIQLVREENIKFSVAAMPNPVQNSARIAISTENAGNVNLRVISSAGQQLFTEVVSCVKGNNVIMRDYSKLPSGTYYIAISQDGKKAVKTFVKQ